MNEKNKIIPIISLALGAIGLSIGCSAFLDDYIFYSKALSTSAEIVSCKELSGKGGLHSYLDVRFLNDAHESVRASLVRHGGGYQTGGKITVYYLPNQFSDVRTKDYFDTYGGPGVILGTGLLFILLGLGELWSGLKDRSKKEI